MSMSVLYPFIEAEYNERTPFLIETIKKLQKKGEVLPLITVDSDGKITKLLKKERLEYEIVKISKIVNAQQFSLTALITLMTRTLANFVYFRNNKVQAVHFTDLSSMMLWGNAAKMNRIPYFISMTQVPKVSKMASLMIADAKSVFVSSVDLIEKLPKQAKSKAAVLPENDELLPFLAERYNLINKRYSFTQTTGLLNK